MIPTLKGFRFTIHHYISTRPPLFWGTQKIPSSLTIEFSEISYLLIWHSEGSWLIPHWCLLFGSCVFTPQVFIGVTWSLQLTDNFNTSSCVSINKYIFCMQHTTHASYIQNINQTWQLNASNMNSKWSFNIERSPKIIAYHYIVYILLVKKKKKIAMLYCNFLHS